ncbi:hypothetical protein ACFZC5_27710 [Nocardia gamkensis]|uniref:hypothetical protein n=1 Tax=Nocardia gamkensis TaxID=352869 RepID=UPI0036ED8190
MFGQLHRLGMADLDGEVELSAFLAAAGLVVEFAEVVRDGGDLEAGLFLDWGCCTINFRISFSVSRLILGRLLNSA